MSKKIYSIEAEDAPEVKGETKPLRNWVNKGKGLIDSLDPSVKNLFDNFKKGLEIAKDQPFLGKRSVVNGVAGPYTWLTYGESFNIAKSIGQFIAGSGIGEKSNIGLYSINRPEWVLAEQACFMFNYCTVPLYDTLGAEAIEFILNQTEVQLIFCSQDKIKNIIALKDKLSHLKTIVSFDPVDSSLVETVKNAGIELLFWSDVETKGSQLNIDFRPPAAEDLCTICYTSGTTGLPKGVMLTHKNMVATGMSYRYAGQMKGGFNFDHTDVHISYLPLAHILERAFFQVMIGVGAKIGFYQGDTLKLLDDVQELKPTIFASVPRLYNRIYDKIWANVRQAGGISEKLFRMAYNSKKSNLPNTVNHLFWDALVFRKVRDRLGGRVKALVSGGAPLSSEVTEFLRLAFSCEVLEGYGQTETCAAGTITQPGDYTVGHVGSPFPCCEVKLIDVPEMGYTTQDKPYPRGEICFRGHNIFKGYYKNPEKTAETLTSDGWNMTGDIGLVDEQGRIKIFDRKKDLFKLSQGEYIQPSFLENVFATESPYIAQIFIHGDSLQSELVAIAVADKENLQKYAQKNGIELGPSDGEFKTFCASEPVKQLIMGEFKRTAKEQKLAGFQTPKNVYVETELFSVENDLFTPTFKLKRNVALKKYREIIDNLYQELHG